MGNKKKYNNREISWLDFNLRVLEEAMDKNNPIMERIKFLAITASNLDEFFMVRIANIMDKIEDEPKDEDASGFLPKQLLNTLSEKIHKFVEKQYTCLHRSIVPALKKEKIVFLKWSDLNDSQRMYVEDYFEKVLFPVLTPLAVDESRPFPLLANRSLNIAVELEKDEKLNFGIVQVPSILRRYFEVPSDDERCYILLEDIIQNQLERLFELHDIKSSCTFRVTRDSDIEIDEDAENLLTEMENSIKRRKRGELVRLEIDDNSTKAISEFLSDTLKVSKKEIYEVDAPIDLTFLSKFAGEDWDDNLKFPSLTPVNPPADFVGYNDMFKAIREKDCMVCNPFESFDSVVRFVRQAAEDEQVLAIKQTLYRVSGNSPIIEALIKAAENGKQVTVLVELKARFDEENNILWAKKLEKAGCHVIYGLAGLKTHCKILLVVRREDDGIRRYIHMGTGNYNDITAKFYTDIGLFTCKEKYGMDASSLFNSLTGYSKSPEYQKLVLAPNGLRKFFETMIKNEINNAENGLEAKIIMKVNSIVDKDIIKLLYKASKAGVEIKLIVRGICCLVPGIEDTSENIQVYSIVGRLLEHSRIFYFHNNADPKIYMGSADLMPRNLDRRVELVFPIEDERLKKRTLKILDILLKDNVNMRIQLPNTEYVRVDKRGKQLVNSQMKLFKLAETERESAINKDNTCGFRTLIKEEKGKNY